MSRNLVIRFW